MHRTRGTEDEVEDTGDGRRRAEQGERDAAETRAELRRVRRSSSNGFGTWSETTRSVRANANTASENPSKREVSARRSLATRRPMLAAERSALGMRRRDA